MQETYKMAEAIGFPFFPHFNKILFSNRLFFRDLRSKVPSGFVTAEDTQA